MHHKHTKEFQVHCIVIQVHVYLYATILVCSVDAVYGYLFSSTQIGNKNIVTAYTRQEKTFTNFNITLVNWI